MKEDFARIRELEERLLSVKGRSGPEVESLLSPLFIEFGASGKVWSRDEAVLQLQQQGPIDRVMDGFQARLLAPGVALATYRIRRVGSDSSGPTVTLRSSVWIDEGQGWQMVFHQGTVIPRSTEPMLPERPRTDAAPLE